MTQLDHWLVIICPIICLLGVGRLRKFTHPLHGQQRQRNPPCRNNKIWYHVSPFKKMNICPWWLGLSNSRRTGFLFVFFHPYATKRNHRGVSWPLKYKTPCHIRGGHTCMRVCLGGDVHATSFVPDRWQHAFQWINAAYFTIAMK